MASEAPTLRALWQEAHSRWPDQTRFDGIMGDASPTFPCSPPGV